MPQAILLIERTTVGLQAAALESQRLQACYLPQRYPMPALGDIYWAKITRILVGMQAAFLRIADDQELYLQASEALTSELLAEKSLQQRQRNLKRPQKQPQGHRQFETQLIQKLCTAGQKCLVQVTKSPNHNKQAMVSRHIQLVGHYLVYLPFAPSQQTENQENLEKSTTCQQPMLLTPKALQPLFKNFVARHNNPLAKQGGLFILRSQASLLLQDSQQKAQQDPLLEAIALEAQSLLDKWQNIDDKSKTLEQTSLLYRQHGSIDAILERFYQPETYNIICNHQENAKEVQSWLQAKNYHQQSVTLQTQTPSAWQSYDVPRLLQEALKKRFWLASGAYLLFESTSVACTIDINSGRNLGKKDFKQTAKRINLEACEAIAQQVILRQISGVILIDFIDMAQDKDRQEVFSCLQKVFEKDKQRCVFLPFNTLGLVHMTRQRIEPSLEELLQKRCPHCQDSGTIANDYNEKEC